MGKVLYINFTVSLKMFGYLKEIHTIGLNKALRKDVAI